MGGIDISVLVQGGAVGIALFMGYLLMQTTNRQAAQMDKVTEVVRQNAEAMTGLREAISTLCRSNAEVQSTVTQQLQAQLNTFQSTLAEMRREK